MISDLSNSNKLKKCTYDLNAKYNIKYAPENIVGVEQNLKPHLNLLLERCTLVDAAKVISSQRLKNKWASMDYVETAV